MPFKCFLAPHFFREVEFQHLQHPASACDSQEVYVLTFITGEPPDQGGHGGGLSLRRGLHLTKGLPYHFVHGIQQTTVHPTSL